MLFLLKRKKQKKLNVNVIVTVNVNVIIYIICGGGHDEYACANLSTIAKVIYISTKICGQNSAFSTK